MVSEARILGVSFDNASVQKGADLGIKSVEDKKWQQAPEKCHG